MESRSTQEPRPVQWMLLGLGVVAFVGVAGVMLVRQLSPPGHTHRTHEAKANLKALYTTERAFLQEKDSYTEDMRLMGFYPELGNRYTYFAARTGRVLPDAERRGSAPATETPMPYQIVGADPKARRFRGTFATFPQTGCPLTLATLPDGTRAGLGITRPPGAAPTDPGVFIGAAAANIDDDPTPDCWSVATVDRVAATGETIYAGQPYNELNDVEN
jgi:type IV pilus assembly protein PilA